MSNVCVWGYGLPHLGWLFLDPLIDLQISLMLLAQSYSTGCLGCSHFLAVRNSATGNMDCGWIGSTKVRHRISWSTSRSVIIGLFCDYGCILLLPLPSTNNSSPIPTSGAAGDVICFINFGHLTRGRCNISVVSVCISASKWYWTF